MKLIEIINNKIGFVIGFLVLVMTGIITFEVGSRYLFNHPTTWAHETTQLTFATYVVFAGAYAHLQRAHVRVDILYTYFPPKGRTVIEWLAFILLVAYCSAALWQGSVMAIDAVVGKEISTTMFAAPLYPFKVMIPIATFLLLLQGFSNMRRGGWGMRI